MADGPADESHRNDLSLWLVVLKIQIILSNI